MKDILKTERNMGDSRNIPPNWFASRGIHEMEDEAVQAKESIKLHKWLEGEKGHRMSWDEAKGEWIRHLPPEKRRTVELAEQLEPYMLLDE